VAVLPALIRDVLDFCYPCTCAHCNKLCATGEFLCDGCLEELVALEQTAACERCGAPLASEGMPCPFCLGKGIRNYRRVLRLATFDEPLKGLIHQMKYHRQWALAEQLGGRLLARERVKAMLAEIDVLVPVPLHFFRQFTRGYNQAALLARCASKASGKPVIRALKRVRHTASQTQLHSRKRRFDNLRNAFRLTNGEAIRGKRVLVIDDVMTTGATLKEVARALRPAKPASLSALVLAVADPKHRGFRAV
jgi:ComF family protein